MNPAETYALVIGINDYASPDVTNLTAACNDADSMVTFLEDAAHVPSQNLIKLRNGQASRHGILEGFKELEKLTAKYYDKTGGSERDPGPGPCIIIFFAGHGARTLKPDGWGDWAPDSAHVEMLCPSDIGMPLAIDREENVKDTGKIGVVEGIPDRTVCWLLNQLSKSRGNNITLILDCCHSAGMNRMGRGLVAREILKPPALSGKADPEVNWALTDREWADEESPEVTRAIHQTPGFGGKFHESHVLLAACGKEQKAYERHGSGLFTTALLNLLPQVVRNYSSLTYATLMPRLNIASIQTPHCEGSNLNKLLFTRRGLDSDPLLIPCTKTKRKTPDGPAHYVLTLGAGAAQGITAGELFSIHENNLAVSKENPNPSIGVLRASEVRTASSTLKRPRKEEHFTMGTHFYAKRFDWSKEPPKVFCHSDDRPWLDAIFPQTDMTKKVVVVENEEETALTLQVEGGRVYFARNDPLLKACEIPKRFPWSRSVSRHEDIRVVVGGWQHFNCHLRRRGSEFPQVKMELHFLKQIRPEEFLTDEDAQQPDNFIVDGGNLLRSEPATLLLPDPDTEEKPLGMTLYNEGEVPLYPYLFYFNPNKLTISPWYLTPIGAGRGRVDPPLRAHSKFCIGYGNGAASPLSFHFDHGRTKDIGYFKLFVSTSPINFNSLIQEKSPFEQGEPGRLGPDASEDSEADLDDFSWGSKVATVIQVLE